MPVQPCLSLRSLALLGAALLLRVSAAPAQASSPEAHAPWLGAPLKAGDPVVIHLAGPRAVSTATYVSKDGNIQLPRAGRVQVGGLLPQEAADRVKAALGGQNDVTLLPITLEPSKFFITGDVRIYGPHTLTKGLTVRQAIFDTAGGVGIQCLYPFYYRLFERCTLSVSTVHLSYEGEVAVVSEELTDWFRTGDRPIRPGDLISVQAVIGHTAADCSTSQAGFVCGNK